MSINQKYTWTDFLKANPEWKKKGLKRTSKEGKKAFEDAFATHAKAHVRHLTAKLEQEVKKATTRREVWVGRVKAAKKSPIAKVLQMKVGQKDHAVHALGRQIERAKALQKSL